MIANWMLYHVEDRALAFAEIRGGALSAATNGDAHVAKIDLLVDVYLSDAAPARCRSWSAAEARDGSRGNLRVPAHLAFSLENGEAQLSPFFVSIGVHQGHGILHITESEAVVQYALSFNESKQMIVGDRLDDLRRRVRDEIGSAGAFVVQTHSGLFIAKKA